MSNMQLNHNQQEEVLAFARQLIRVPGTSGNEDQVASLLNRKTRIHGNPTKKRERRNPYQIQA